MLSETCPAGGWARRTFPESPDAARLALFLRGHKLIGGYALTRIGPADGRERWLLVKEADRFADTTRDPVQRQPESVKSGRVNHELTPSTG
jgi:hypothetical protein